jgi:hypothetical protein
MIGRYLVAGQHGIWCRHNRCIGGDREREGSNVWSAPPLSPAYRSSNFINLLLALNRRRKLLCQSAFNGKIGVQRLAVQIQPKTRAVYHRGVIACGKCAAPIYILRLNALAEEFSVQCRKCGYRGVYFKRLLSIVDLPERRKKPRR